MSEAVKKNLQELRMSINKNLATVQKTVYSGGSKASQAPVISAAKYYSALSRLAKE